VEPPRRIGSYKLSATGQSPFYAEYPYPGGSLSSDGGGLTAAQMADWLGTTRAIYSYSGGNWIKSIAHAPFGETYGGSSQNFTGQWSDADTVNTTYYFPERQYRSSQGRWLSPDQRDCEPSIRGTRNRGTDMFMC